MLSVSGMRGLVGRSLTPVEVTRFAAAVGSWLRVERGTEAPTVVVGRDSRPSGAVVEAAAVAGLAGVGCRVIRLGVLSTPGVATAIAKHRADGGLVLTASHNPLGWNGVKPLRHDGVAPPPDAAAELRRRFESADVTWVDDARIGRISDDPSAAAWHIDRVLEQVDADLIRSAKLHAVVDSVHGAGGHETVLLMHALGVTLTHLYPEPTGWFPHPPEPTRDNLKGLCDAVPFYQADVGFAQDPDADRLAVVDKDGTYLGEEYTLALAAAHILKKGESVAANLSTSRMIDDVAARVGGRVVRSAVGEAHVARAMREAGATLGGEGNGGVILSTISQVRDSLAGMAVLLELLATRRRDDPDVSLGTVAAELPRYEILKEKIDLNPTLDMPSLLARLHDRLTDADRLDTRDGLRADWPDRWLHVRGSNTEPILRLIAEAPDASTGQALIERARAAVEEV